MAGNNSSNLTRSENNAVANPKYPDLNMTHYPARIDSRNAQETSNFNPNMQGFWSAGDASLPSGQEPDYNMAEHVNALADAVMAIQRILGANPHIDSKGGNTTGTVSTRIGGVENKDGFYDERYGGIGWKTSYGQTILTHTHGGGSTEASQIRLATDVSGKLKKANIDLTAATGVTGTDIYISKTNETKISDAINDKISSTTGGTLKEDSVLNVKGIFNSRLNREYTSVNMTGGTNRNDVKCLTGVAKEATGTEETIFIRKSEHDLLAGKFVLGVRVKVDSRVDENVLRIGFYDYNGADWTTRAVKNIKGTSFDAANQYKMFYLVFDHEPIIADGAARVTIRKPATSANVKVTVDYAYITPAHPAVFDM